MNKTIAYYEANATDYFEQTRDIDMSPLYDRFLPLLPPGGHILDAGCGSGRDTKVFLERGFRVTAIEASAPLAALASRFAGCRVRVMRFDELPFEAEFDGIWACASLLHVPRRELPAILHRLAGALVLGGYLYVSFKRGDAQRSSGGRHFTDMTRESLLETVASEPKLSAVELWETADRREDRASEFWINAVLRRGTVPPQI